MEKNICKIKKGKELGTGFFCKIPFPNKNNMLPVFITNNHIINGDFLNKKNMKIEINIKEEKKAKVINLNDRMNYTNEEYDITIIEIKEKDNIKSYLNLDNKIIDDIINNDNNNNEYEDKTMYIIQYAKGELSVSYGILDSIYEEQQYNFNHKCSTEGGSSGYNKGIFLNYPIKEFIKLNYYDNKYEKLLKQFNKKYNLDIKDTRVDKIYLPGKKIGNKGLKDLIKIQFIKLKELNLYNGNISDIKALEDAKFDKLKILHLGFNKISNIDILEKVNFPELKELNLKSNNISDIKVLEKVKFEKLEKLNLEDNKISDFSILNKVNFKNLKELKLGKNIKSEYIQRYLNHIKKTNEPNCNEKLDNKTKVLSEKQAEKEEYHSLENSEENFSIDNSDDIQNEINPINNKIYIKNCYKGFVYIKKNSSNSNLYKSYSSFALKNQQNENERQKDFYNNVSKRNNLNIPSLNFNFKNNYNESERSINDEESESLNTFYLNFGYNPNIKYVTQKTSRSEMNNNINNISPISDAKENLYGYENKRKNKNMGYSLIKKKKEKMNKADDKKFILSSKSEKNLKVNSFLRHSKELSCLGKQTAREDTKQNNLKKQKSFLDQIFIAAKDNE